MKYELAPFVGVASIETPPLANRRQPLEQGMAGSVVSRFSRAPDANNTAVADLGSSVSAVNATFTMHSSPGWSAPPQALASMPNDSFCTPSSVLRSRWLQCRLRCEPATAE